MATQELTPKEKQELQDKEQTRPGRYFVPDVDIFEDDQAMYVRADMPGVDQQHVDVELHDNTLTLHGQVSLDEYEGLQPVYSEYNVGHFLRRFTLVDAASFDEDKITAKVFDGVLELRLPKAERAKSRRIPITA